MSRFRGLVMALIVAGVVGFVAVLRTSAGAAETPAGQPGSASGSNSSAVILRSSTSTPAAVASPTALSLPAIIASAAPAILPPNTVTAVSAQSIQTIVPINTPSAGEATAVAGWNPPAMGVPIAHNPFDHFWFIRPVAAKYRNFELADYPYGSNGAENDLRIHHGIDLPNPIGVEVLAAGDGTVIIAQKGFTNEYETITSYGNVIVIDHDFGYNGQHIYTLYAHLSAILVQRDQRVRAGERIGLIGNTGQVTGPHVHFEVRIGRDTYASTRNPILWMAPYVNTGVVAGRVGFSDKSPAQDAPVTLIDSASGNVVDRTDTYAGAGINADDNWNENFVFPDVPVGRYLITSTYNTTTWSATIDVIPGTVNWVDLQRYVPDSGIISGPLPTPTAR